MVGASDVSILTARMLGLTNAVRRTRGERGRVELRTAELQAEAAGAASDVPPPEHAKIQRAARARRTSVLLRTPPL